MRTLIKADLGSQAAGKGIAELAGYSPEAIKLIFFQRHGSSMDN